MKRTTAIGLDTAKSIFQVHGIDAEGNVTAQRKLKRRQVLSFFANLPPCLIGIEACAASHHWSRELQALGHRVGTYIFGRHYPRVVAERGELPAQMMGADTSFHADQAARYVGKPPGNLKARPFLLDDNGTTFIKADDVKRILTDIDAQSGDIGVCGCTWHGVTPWLWVEFPQLPDQRAGARPDHPISGHPDSTYDRGYHKKKNENQ